MGKIAENPILAGVLSILLLVIPLAAPGLLTPLMLGVPLPILLVGLRKGLRASVLAALLLLIGAGVLGENAGFALVTFLLFAVAPLLSVWLVRGRWGIFQTGGAIFAAGVLILVVGFVLAGLMGVDLAGLLEARIANVKDGWLEVAREAKLDARQMVEVQAGLDRVFGVMALLFPGLAASGWLLLQVGNLLLARVFLERWREPYYTSEDVTRLRLPFLLVWPMIVMGVLAVLTSGGVRFAASNLAFFLTMPYLFQGLAVVQTGFRRFKVVGFLQGAFYAFLIVWQELVPLIMVVGLFDTWVDFRKHLVKRDGAPPEPGQDPPAR